jgi:hypothetical protein
MKPPGEVNSGPTVAMLEITGLPNRTALYFFAVGHVNDLGQANDVTSRRIRMRYAVIESYGSNLVRGLGCCVQKIPV